MRRRDSKFWGDPVIQFVENKVTKKEVVND
jgi:hypothetical protein